MVCAAAFASVALQSVLGWFKACVQACTLQLVVITPPYTGGEPCVCTNGQTYQLLVYTSLVAYLFNGRLIATDTRHPV